MNDLALTVTPAVEELESFALTATQRGLLADSLVATDKGVHVEQVVWRLDVAPDAARFREAWQRAFDAFDALRLSFAWPKSSREPEQALRQTAGLIFREVDYSRMDGADPEARLARFLAQDRGEGFELLSAPLMRVSLVTLGSGCTACVWTIHHSIIDGHSFGLVLDRVWGHYTGRKTETGSSVEPAFRDFLRWLARQDVAPGAKHFAALLEGFAQATPLPLQEGTARTALGKALCRQLQLDAQMSASLRARAKEAGATSGTLLQLAWAMLLARYSGQSDVVFGSTWAARAGTIAGADGVVGPFISTLPVRVRLDEAPTLRGLLASLRAQHLALRPVMHTSLAQIKANSALAGESQLFQTLVVFDRKSLQAQLEDTDPSWRAQRVWSRTEASYSLVLAARLEGEQLELELEADAGLYDAEQVERLLADYARLVRGICERWDDSPLSVPMLEPGLYQRLTTLEALREEVPVRPSAIVRILEQARARPTALAVSQIAGEEISYGLLRQRVLQLASALRKHGVNVGDRVGVWLPRSVSGIVALLAVQAAGATFVPLDTQSPVPRVEYVVQDAKLSLLLVSGLTRGRLPASQVRELDLDELELDGMPEAQNVGPEPESPAYVIYTSGSTGAPKGVVVPHSALANHLAATLELFNLTPSDRVLQFATSAFDVALEEILPTLAAGATLVLRDDAMIRTAGAFFDAVSAAKLSVVNLPTAYWHQLVRAEHLAWPACLRLVVVGGERASADSHGRFRAAASGHLRWLNAYGPTEATITSTSYDDAEGDHGPSGIPIGRPLTGVSHFVLDQQLQPVPPGAVGQLFIGGAGLAQGYLFRDELTAAHFVAHPWRAGARLYATGDRVFQTPSGNYVYVDRPDNQVKLRGFRIELGEIEAQLRRHPAISEAAVVLRDRGDDKVLVGFVIADEHEVSEQELREHLAARLPVHMLPARLVVASSLPATLSGKVDRRALAERPLTLPPQSSEPPPSIRGAAHSAVPILLQIWSEVLGTPVTSTSANFFDLGGHSLLVVRMFSELEQRTGQTCNAAAFFQNPTVAHLAELLRETTSRQRASSMQLASGAPGVRPLFFAPGLTGRAVDFVHLVRALARDIPVVALQLHAFADAERPGETLGDAVKDVVDLMQRVQPKGPYSIAGFSAGGVFAVAIGEELGLRGEAADFIGMIDSVPPASVPMASPLTSPRRFARLSRTVVGRVQEILEQPRPLWQLWSRTRVATLRSVARWHRASAYQPTVAELFGDVSGNFSAEDEATMQRYLDATLHHQFGLLSLDLVLFRVPLDPPEGPYEQSLGWQHVTRGHVSVEQLAGRHKDLMTAAGCRELAALLGLHLTRRRDG